MNEQANGQALAGDPQAVRKRNRGWFQPGDGRINRMGRPRGPERAARRAQAGKPVCGRVRILFVPDDDLRRSLSSNLHPWLINLPKDFRIVAVDRDPNRKGFVMTIYSENFREIGEGEQIPEFKPAYNGLKWRTWSGW
jgi:hypothetical protein